MLERRMCTYLDNSTKITQWASEPFAIKYVSLVDNKVHNYYPDFVFVIDNQKVLVEVKPKKQLKQPSKPKTITNRTIKNYNTSLEMYLKNVAKINASKNFANENNFKFILITEDDIKNLLKLNAQ